MAPDELLERLLSDLSALPEEEMRFGLLGSRLSPMEPELIARTFDALYKKTRTDARARAIASLLVDHEGLIRAIGPEKYSLVYHASLRLGLEKVSRLFTDLPPHKKGIRGYDKEEEVKMEHLTLGQRRELSKKGVKDTIDRLLSDPDRIVIKNILENPRTTETEVLKVASKRPNSPEILKLLVTHKKWSKRGPVRRAIVLNPYSPPRVSIALLEMMLFQDLKNVTRDKTVHPQVRLAATDILKHRGMGKDDSGGE